MLLDFLSKYGLLITKKFSVRMDNVSHISEGQNVKDVDIRCHLPKVEGRGFELSEQTKPLRYK